MQRLAAAISEKHQTAGDGSDEPKQHVDQIDPDRVLSPLDSAIALRVLVDEKFAKEAKDSGPQDATLMGTISAKTKSCI